MILHYCTTTALEQLVIGNWQKQLAAQSSEAAGWLGCWDVRHIFLTPGAQLPQLFSRPALVPAQVNKPEPCFCRVGELI